MKVIDDDDNLVWIIHIIAARDPSPVLDFSPNPDSVIDITVLFESDSSGNFCDLFRTGRCLGFSYRERFRSKEASFG